MNANDSTVLQAARRLELDAAIGLAASLLCCVIGLFLCWRSYRQATELIAGEPLAGLPLETQSRVIGARVLSIAGIIVSLAVPVTSIIWSIVAYSFNR